MKILKLLFPLLLSSCLVSAGPSDTTTVAFTQLSVTVAKDSVFTLGITVDKVSNLFSFTSDVTFSPGKFQVISVTEGTFLNNNGTVPTSLLKSIFSDKIMIALTRLGTANGGVSTLSTKTLLSVTFKKLTSDTTTIGFSNTGLLLPDGTTQIPLKTKPSTIKGYAAGPVSAQLSISPSSQLVEMNSIFSVSLSVDSAYGIYAYATDINYNSKIARYISSSEGTALNSGGSVSTSFIVSVDTVIGKITVGHSRLGAVDGMIINDALSMCSLSFKKLSYDTVAFSISNYGLLKNDGVSQITANILNGKCYPTGSPVSTSDLNFGNAVVKEILSKNYKIFNLSKLNKIDISNLSNASTYFYTNQSLPFSIPAKDSVTINLNFKPTVFGVYKDTLVISFLGGNKKAPLNGTSPVPTLNLSKSDIDYGTVTRSGPTTQSTIVTTTTVNQLIIDTIYTKTSRFKPNINKGRINSPENLQVDIELLPKGAGQMKDTLYLKNNSATTVKKIPLKAVSPATAAPQNLTVFNASNQTITLKWKKNLEIDFLRYRIYFGTTSGGETLGDSTTTSRLDTTKVISGLTNGQKYYFFVTAVDSSFFESLHSIEVNGTPIAPPAAPIPNTAGSILQTSFLANWGSSAAATGYRIDVGLDNLFTSLLTGYNDKDIGNVTSYSITGLSANNTYYYRVRAYNAGGLSLYSATITTTTLPIPPSAPIANSATDIFQTVLTANWNSSLTATGYYIDVSANNSFSTFVSGYNNKDAGNITSLNIIGLSALTTYYYRVRAYNMGGTSINSNTITALTLINVPPAPVTSATNNILQTSFTLNWSASSTATGYIIDVALDNLFASLIAGYTDKDIGNVLTYNLTGLNPLTTYYCRVRAYNAGGAGSNSGTIITTTLPNPPEAPAAISASSISQTSMIVNWNASSSATGYRLDISTDNSFSSFVSGFNDLNVNNVTTFNVTGLTANTTYFYRVRAYNSGGNSSNSNIITASTLINPPSAPVASAGSLFTQTSFSANWASVPNASGYRIDVSATNTFSSFISTGYNDLNVNNVTTYSISGLTANTIYYYRVRAYNSGGPSLNSNIITARTLPDPPSVPVANAATNILQTGFTANWSNPATSTGFQIDVATDIGFSSFVSGYNNKDIGNIITVSISGLTASTTYYYRVRAYNSGGISNSSGIISLTTAAVAIPPSTPTANAATNITSSSFSANWSSTLNATGYNLDVSTNNTFSSFVTGFNNLDIGNALTYAVTGLNPTTTYYYRVRALNSDGVSPYSGSISLTTLISPPPSPVATSATTIASTGFTANWNSSSTATGYNLDVATDNGFTSIVSGLNNKDVANVTAFNVSGLTPNTIYYYRVRAYNTGGSSGNSNIITTTTLAGTLAAPVANIASLVTQTGFTASWTASTFATGYFLDIATDNSFTSFVAGFNNKDILNVTSYTVSGLIALTDYYYRVRAYNTGGTSPNSNSILTTTLSVSAPAAPLVGNIVQPTCTVSTGSVDLTGLPSSGSWTLTRTPGGITTSGSGTTYTVTSLPSGSYTFTVTNSLSLMSQSSSNVVISTQPVTPSSPTVGTITHPTCSVSTGSVVLSGLPGTGSWTLTASPGGAITNGTGASTIVSGISSGTYSYTVKNASGCTSGSSANIVINAQPTAPSAPTVGTITNPTCTVSTGSVVLSGLPGTGSWTLIASPGSTTTNGTGTNTTISGISPGTYTYTVTNSSGCVSGSSSNVVILSQPSVPSAPTIGTITQTTCSSSTGSVIINGLPSSGSWTLTVSPGGTITTGSGTSKTITGLSAGTYTYTVTNSVSCVSPSSSNIVINSQPPPASTPTVVRITHPVCEITTGTVDFSGLPSLGTWTLTRSPGGTITNGTGTSSSVSSIPSGNYTFTVTNASGCTSAGTALITINTPKPGLVPRIVLKWNEMLICINKGDSIATFQWYKDNNPVTTADKKWKYYISNKQQGVYKVETVDNNGCKNSSNLKSISSSKSLSIYPIPAKNNFTLNLDDERLGKTKISLINEKGTIVLEYETEKDIMNLTKTIPVNDLNEGTYFVRVVINKEAVFFEKIVVIK